MLNNLTLNTDVFYLISISLVKLIKIIVFIKVYDCISINIMYWLNIVKQHYTLLII